ncbi:hypothetical protein ACFQY5_40495 [Paeniroseomonas aquatica]|uniref:Addiction module toxin, HicA family n=1 Tax=Paeniroseomonas aquatica TaxID=373043 RepID=A0ABT8AG87_9PROT|nr:hypothetical protein [Paeniroseomonas aquatica]MDN3568774.1 hypothetical protein [Paeniroseomonas aquatica]
MAADQQCRLQNAGRHVVVQKNGGHTRQGRLGARTKISYNQATDLLGTQF